MVAFQALDNVEHRLGVLKVNTPVVLESFAKSVEYEELQDIITYLLDTFHTLHNFISIYPAAAKVFHEHELDVR